MLQIRRLPKTLLKSARIMLILPTLLTPIAPPLRLHSFVVGSAFVGTSTSVRKTKQSKISCLGLSLRLTFERVWVTQELLCIPLGVALDKTLSTNGEKKARPHSILSRKMSAFGQGLVLGVNLGP